MYICTQAQGQSLPDDPYLVAEFSVAHIAQETAEDVQVRAQAYNTYTTPR